VHLLFLMVTPAERPECQLALLRQVARLADKLERREALMNAVTQAELLEIIGKPLPEREGRRAGISC
jgi:mannitol/fructose-specific phosphotransferase system IIA component (Ntr-type)